MRNRKAERRARRENLLAELLDKFIAENDRDYAFGLWGELIIDRYLAEEN